MLETPTTLENRAINTLRFLAVDAVEQAQSGHPGTPMGAATMMYVLWERFLKHSPSNPQWPDRDRFILSPGHASLLLYGMLHLTGYDLPLEDIQNFRQWGSKAAGHPEYPHTPGVEVTTGPLGQGFAHGIGMALAERWLAERYNREEHELFNHYTYAIVSDGDMQEGVTSEAASLAGTLGLDKLIYLYDDNSVQIEGSTKLVFSENVARRFDAYGWQVIGPINGHDTESIATAIEDAHADTDRPSLIIAQTIIGYGAPAQATHDVHSDPLGSDAIKFAKDALDWPHAPTFHIPGEVRDAGHRHVERGAQQEAAWQAKLDAYACAYPEDANCLQMSLRGELPVGWDADLDTLFEDADDPIATRNAAGTALNALVKRISWIVGGSADLAPSTKATLIGYGDLGWHHYCGNNLHFGVREHAMGAITNGMALHGGIMAYSATFLTFADYMRPPMRIGALMGIRVAYVFTHDSIGVGEDGPTHQPIEQLMNLRSVPNMTVIRPADANETAQSWRAALQNTDGPTTLIFSRQNLPILDQRQLAPARGLLKGAYTLWQARDDTPDVILIGTGSELHITLEAGQRLADEGINARVVSMPSWELFDRQPDEYRERVFPKDVRARIAVEAGTVIGWERYVGLDGAVIGMRSFGASAPAPLLYEKFGITADAVIKTAQDMLKITR